MLCLTNDMYVNIFVSMLSAQVIKEGKWRAKDFIKIQRLTTYQIAVRPYFEPLSWNFTFKTTKTFYVVTCSETFDRFGCKAIIYTVKICFFQYIKLELFRLCSNRSQLSTYHFWVHIFYAHTTKSQHIWFYVTSCILAYLDISFYRQDVECIACH